MEFLIVLAILLIVVLVVSAPLRHAAGRSAPDFDAQPEAGGGHDDAVRELAELEAVRDAKYREIRDAELDYRTGKLSEEDFEAVDQGLRAEAIEILRALDDAKERAGATIGERW